MNQIEKNPIKIIYLARNKLLPFSVWILYFVLIILMLILTFVVPNKILMVSYQILDTHQFIVVSISALAFILSMYMFGREVYTIEDFARLYVGNPNVYYGYLADYLFPALLWCLVITLSITKIVIIVSISQWLLELLRVCFLSIVILAFLSTITLVIHNMNRVSNKVVVESKKSEIQ